MLLEPGAHWTVRRELVCYIDPVHNHVTLCLSHTNLGSASLSLVPRGGLIVPTYSRRPPLRLTEKGCSTAPCD
jgi:hypothetical protein